MPDTLPVHLNRGDRHSLEVPASFETDDSFVVAVHNHGEAARVHVHLNADLLTVASVGDANHYVQANGTTEIPVAVRGEGPAAGKVKLVSGYGAVTRWVDVVLVEPKDEPVVVADDPAEPRPDRPTGDPTGPFGSLADRSEAAVALLAVLALAVAVGAAALVQSASVVAGAAVVVLAVGVAAALVLR